MTVRVYRSDDASAPVLSGQVGALIGVLDACLVDGYGSKTAAGWAKEFTGTNLRAYRAASGARMRLRVDDTAAQEGRIVGYESMSDVNTGTGPFPTSTQMSGGLFVRKSATANATARPWILIATGTAFYFLPYSEDTVLGSGAAGNNSGHIFFGDFVSYKPGDAYNCIIIAATATGASGGRLGSRGGISLSSFSGLGGHFVPRAHTQAGTSINVTKVALGDYSNTGIIGPNSGNLPAYPEMISGGVPLAPIEILESASPVYAVRGRMPGMWAPLCLTVGAHLDTFTGSGELAGKTFTVANSDSNGSSSRPAFETSDTW